MEKQVEVKSGSSKPLRLGLVSNLLTCAPWKSLRFISHKSIIKDVYVKTNITEDLAVSIDIMTEIKDSRPGILNIEIIDPNGLNLQTINTEIETTAAESSNFVIEEPIH